MPPSERHRTHVVAHLQVRPPLGQRHQRSSSHQKNAALAGRFRPRPVCQRSAPHPGRALNPRRVGQTRSQRRQPSRFAAAAQLSRRLAYRQTGRDRRLFPMISSLNQAIPTSTSTSALPPTSPKIAGSPPSNCVPAIAASCITPMSTSMSRKKTKSPSQPRRNQPPSSRSSSGTV